MWYHGSQPWATFSRLVENVVLVCFDDFRARYVHQKDAIFHAHLYLRANDVCCCGCVCIPLTPVLKSERCMLLWLCVCAFTQYLATNKNGTVVKIIFGQHHAVASPNFTTPVNPCDARITVKSTAAINVLTQDELIFLEQRVGPINECVVHHANDEDHLSSPPLTESIEDALARFA